MLAAGLLSGLTLAVAMLLTGTPARGAVCGKVETAPAEKDVNPGRPPLAVGDSVMLAALPYLARVGYDVNAHGCRDWAEGLALLRSLKRDGKLPHMVVMALGADRFITRADIASTLRLLGPNRVLTLVVPRELGGGTSNDATVCRQAGGMYRHRVMVLDWIKFSRGHSSWFVPDGLHLTPEGAAFFARMFKKALPFAAAGEFPDGAHFPG